VDLAHEAVEVDDRPSAAQAGAGRPRTRQRLGPVTLAHLPERERAQEHAQRRWRRDAVPEHHRRLAERDESAAAAA
jgi:hypothetical protein